MDPAPKRQRLNESKSLVLKLGSESFSLCHDDVQRHPGSLITDLAEVHASSSSSTDSNIIDLEKLPNSLFTNLHGALKLTASLYRFGSLSPEVLQHALAHIVSSSTASNSNSSSGQAARSWEQAEDTLYQTITQLLSFLIIPGPVTRWLPDLEQLPLSQARVMSFIFNCHMHTAAEALLQFKPCASPATQMYGEFQAAAFVVTANCNLGAAPDVEVWSLDYSPCLDQLLTKPHDDLTASLRPSNFSGKRPHLDKSLACTRLPRRALAGAPKMLSDFGRLTQSSLRRSVTAGKDKCGRQLAKILQKAAQEIGLTVGCIACTVGFAGNHVSLWVVRW